MALDVNTIATDADLAKEFGGIHRLNSTMSDVARRDGYRASALSDALDALASRSPAIHETDLLVPSQLQKAVVYRALSKICLASVTQDGDRHYVLGKNYQVEYLGAIRGNFSRAATGGVGAQSGGGSFSYRRR